MDMQTNHREATAPATIAVPVDLLRRTIETLDGHATDDAESIQFLGRVMAAGKCSAARLAIFENEIAAPAPDAIQDAMNDFKVTGDLVRELAPLIIAHDDAQKLAGNDALRDEYRRHAEEAAKLDPAKDFDRVKFGIAWRRCKTLQKQIGVPLGAHTSLHMTREKILAILNAQHGEQRSIAQRILKRSPDRAKRSAKLTAELDQAQARMLDLAEEITAIDGTPPDHIATDTSPASAE